MSVYKELIERAVMHYNETAKIKANYLEISDEYPEFSPPNVFQIILAIPGSARIYRDALFEKETITEERKDECRFSFIFKIMAELMAIRKTEIEIQTDRNNDPLYATISKSASDSNASPANSDDLP